MCPLTLLPMRTGFGGQSFSPAAERVIRQRRDSKLRSKRKDMVNSPDRPQPVPPRGDQAAFYAQPGSFSPDAGPGVRMTDKGSPSSAGATDERLCGVELCKISCARTHPGN